MQLRRDEYVVLHLARTDLELRDLSGSNLDPKSGARDEDQWRHEEYTLTSSTARRASHLEVSGCWENNAAAHHVVGNEAEE